METTQTPESKWDLPCPVCGTEETPMRATDDRLHVLCEPCANDYDAGATEVLEVLAR